MESTMVSHLFWHLLMKFLSVARSLCGANLSTISIRSGWEGRKPRKPRVLQAWNLFQTQNTPKNIFVLQ